MTALRPLKFACALAVALGMFTVAPVARAAHELPNIPAKHPELRALQKEFLKYSDPFLAVHDGYFSTVGCVQYPDGGMGVHFVNLALMGPNPDPMKPPILIYDWRDGRLHLVAVEWFVPLATGVKGRPSLFGQPFEGPMEGHTPLLPKALHHYDLHVWIFTDNPKGMFHHSNPKIDCMSGVPYGIREAPPPAVPHQ